jgi:hypothetical protein
VVRRLTPGHTDSPGSFSADRNVRLLYLFTLLLAGGAYLLWLGIDRAIAARAGD